MRPGTLYVVATPIGNLEDLGPRAARILGQVRIIAAEDTRHSRKLLQHIGVTTPMLAYHEFNERKAAPGLIQRLRDGEDVALISDAGTPLISDPGFRLVNLAVEAGIPVVPVPGPSAITCALSASGLSTARFSFEGYLPEKQAARRARLEQLAADPRTLVFFEAPHRIEAFIADCRAAFGDDRVCVVARELTKQFETIRRDDLAGMAAWMAGAAERRKGEFVVVIQGAPEDAAAGEDDLPRILAVLLEYLSVRDAAAAAAALSGVQRNEAYRIALAIKSGERRK